MREAPVVLRLTVEDMKHQMLHAFQEHSLEVEAHIKDACDRFIKGGELDRQIQTNFEKCVQRELESFFTWGAGKKAVQDALEAGFASRFGKKES